MNQRWRLVDTQAKLAKAEGAIRSSRVIALDTEYDSFRYFRDRLCLIQVQTGEKTWLIDPLAGLDLACLGEALNDPGVRKILHAGDNDIRILKRDYGFAFRNIFDTHRAASLLGVRQLALGKLLETYLGITLEKDLQRSRWDLRPLTEEQLDYAALDTAHLPALAGRLEEELNAKGLLAEADRTFAGMTAVLWQPRTLDRMAHRRLPGFATLTGKQRERIRDLFRWRFEKARETDRAAFMILSDQQLASLAKMEHPSREAMAALVPAERAQRFIGELLTILQKD